MSFVPVTGTAVLRPGDPPREGVVEFRDERRTVALPMSAALPVLTRAHRLDDLHPSVGLLSGAALLAMKLVAAGRFEPAPGGGSWRVSPLHADDDERVRRLARARVHDGLDAVQAEAVVRRMLDAVVDAMPRAAPAQLGSGGGVSGGGGSGGVASGGSGRPGAFAERLQDRLARRRDVPAESDLPHLVGVSLRVEADEEELVAGSVRVVLQVHDERDALHVCDAALLWSQRPTDHGFGSRARTHATIALRAAAEAWPVLDRLLALRVPDQLTLEVDELVSLLDVGVGALKDVGVDVLWPKELGRDLTATTVLDASRRAAPGRATREEPLQDPLLGTDTVLGFRWQLALHGEPLTQAEMDQLAHAASPVLRLRGSWAVVDPHLARKAKKRLIREVTPTQAVAAALTGVAELPAGEEPVIVGATLLPMRDRLLAAASRTPIEAPPGLQAELRDYQRHGLTWLADVTGLGLGACLADDMGLGKTLTLIALHLHRVEIARTSGSPAGPTLVVCPASLLGNWEAEIRRFAPGVDVRRFHGGQRDLGGLTAGFVLTTYGTMRRDHAALDAVEWDLVVADEAST